MDDQDNQEEVFDVVDVSMATSSSGKKRNRIVLHLEDGDVAEFEVQVKKKGKSQHVT